MKPDQKKPQIDFSGSLNKIKGVMLNFVVPLVSLLIIILVISLYIYPSIKNLPLKKDELAQKTTTKQILSTKVANLKRLIDFQNVLDENSEIVNKVLVPEAEVPRLLDQVTQVSDKAGMSLDRLSYSYGGSRGSSEAIGVGDFDLVTVSMGGSSTFDQLIIFMELVEKASRFISVPNFRYSVSSQPKEEGDVSSTFSIDSPYLFVQSTAVTDEPINLDITSTKFVDFMSMLKGLDYYDFINKDIEAEEVTPEEEITLEPEPALETEPVSETVEEEPILPTE